MLKLLGAILIIGSCGALGLSARQDLRTRIAAIDGCLKALERMESEIAFRLTPIQSCIILGNQFVKQICKFLGDW